MGVLASLSRANTLPSLVDDLVELGVLPGATVMVHSSLREVGWTVGGPVTVIRLFSTRELVNFAEGYFREALR